MTPVAQIETLIARVARGDRRAFATLHDATGAQLFGVTMHILGNEAEAGEALQEVFVTVWHEAGQHRVNGLSPMAWLITLTRNQAVDRLRARRAGAADIDGAVDLADLTPGPGAQVATRPDAARMAACLATLDPDRADAVRCAYLEGESYAELASRFGLPLNTVRIWLRQGLLTLKDCLTS